MKMKCVLVCAVLISMLERFSYAQNNSYYSVPVKHLAVTYNKTTNLIFPYSVQNIDRGSKDILVQQPRGTGNIVQIKADKPDFAQTNLSVITVDGRLYSFTVDYTPDPTQLNIVVERNSTDDSILKPVVFLASKHDEALLQSVAEKILEMKGRHGRRDRDDLMEFQLNGIYINHDVLYFRLQLRNKSNISYDADVIKFIIKDKKTSRRTASQEDEITPIYKSGNLKNVPADSVSSGVIALPKFTLGHSKILSIEVSEKNGARNLNLVINNRQIMKALAIKEF